MKKKKPWWWYVMGVFVCIADAFDTILAYVIGFLTDTFIGIVILFSLVIANAYIIIDYINLRF